VFRHTAKCKETAACTPGVDPVPEVPINPTFLLARHSVKGIIEGKSQGVRRLSRNLLILT